MKYSFLGFGFIMFGLFGLMFIIMFESITINNESEYYVLKEAMEAAMLESVDLLCYREGNEGGISYVGKMVDGKLEMEETGACGNHDIKIIEQKFVENFTRRFAASISGDVSEYTIEFYDIIEKPPKATVVIRGKTQEYSIGFNSDGSTFSITNDLSGILEMYN